MVTEPIKPEDSAALQDACPRHGGECYKEYDFGRGDVTVYTYRGCFCASVASDTSAWLCHAYVAAVGHARAMVAQAALPVPGDR